MSVGCVCVRRKLIGWNVSLTFCKVPQLSKKAKAVEKLLSMSIRCYPGWFCFNQIDFFVGHHLAVQDAFQRLAMASSFAFENVDSFGIAWQKLSSSHSPWGNKNGKIFLGKSADGKLSFCNGEQDGRHHTHTPHAIHICRPPMQSRGSWKVALTSYLCSINSLSQTEVTGASICLIHMA